MLELLEFWDRKTGVGRRSVDKRKIALRWACVYKDTKLLKHLADVLGCKIEMYPSMMVMDGVH